MGIRGPRVATSPRATHPAALAHFDSDDDDDDDPKMFFKSAKNRVCCN